MLHAGEYELGWGSFASDIVAAHDRRHKRGMIVCFPPQQERLAALPVNYSKNFWEQAMDKDRITGSARELAGKVEGVVGDATGDPTTQAAARVREATGTMQNLYGQAKDAARGATDAAAGYAKNVHDNSGDTLRDNSEMLAKKVRENPLGSIMIAGAVGFALALLMTRPLRRPPSRSRYYS
jgi:uncharacterized protein YjbJ (UPF0337 family)